MRIFDRESMLLWLICSFVGPTATLAEGSDPFRFLLVRAPEILDGTPCSSRSDAKLGVLIFSTEITPAKFPSGRPIKVITPDGEVRTAKQEILPNANKCHPLAGAEGTSLALLKFDRPISWSRHAGEEAMLAYGDGSYANLRFGKVSKQEAPSAVQKEINQLAGVKDSRRGNPSAQVFSFPRSPKKFAVISTSVLPEDYEQVGDKGITYFSTFWEVAGGTWKRTAKVEGAIRIFSVIDLGNSEGPFLAVNENEGLSGVYKVIEFKDGKPGDTVQTLYRWMD